MTDRPRRRRVRAPHSTAPVVPSHVPTGAAFGGTALDGTAELPAVVSAALDEVRASESSGVGTPASVARVMRAVRARPMPERATGAASDAPAHLLASRSLASRWRRAGVQEGRLRREGRWWVGAIAASLVGAVALAGHAWQGRTAVAPTQARRRQPARAGDVADVSTPVVRAAQFFVVAPGARQVAVVGDFNGWSAAATPMRHDAGAWTARVVLPEGRYVYAYVVDGTRWMSDPSAPLAPADGFGRQSSVLVLSTQVAAR